MIDRTPKPCHHPVADHQHGTYAAYTLDACRCLPCAFACFEYRNDLTERHENSDPPMVDSTEVITHAQALMASGWTLRSIARVSGVSLTGVQRVACEPGTGRPARVTIETADAILALPLGVNQKYMTSAVGVVRRIRALATLGWSFKEIGARAGMSQRSVSDLNRGAVRNVRPHTYAALCRVYDELWDQPATGACVARMRSRAERQGWAPPMAWSDDEIDDPAAQPDLGGESDSEALRRALHEQGLPDAELAAEVGITPDAARIWRRRRGLPINRRYQRRAS